MATTTASSQNLDDIIKVDDLASATSDHHQIRSNRSPATMSLDDENHFEVKKNGNIEPINEKIIVVDDRQPSRHQSSIVLDQNNRMKPSRLESTSEIDGKQSLAVKVQNVAYYYDKNKPVLKDMTLYVPEGMVRESFFI